MKPTFHYSQRNPPSKVQPSRKTINLSLFLILFPVFSIFTSASKICEWICHSNEKDRFINICVSDKEYFSHLKCNDDIIPAPPEGCPESVLTPTAAPTDTPEPSLTPTEPPEPTPVMVNPPVQYPDPANDSLDTSPYSQEGVPGLSDSPQEDTTSDPVTQPDPNNPQPPEENSTPTPTPTRIPVVLPNGVSIGPNGKIGTSLSLAIFVIVLISIAAILVVGNQLIQSMQQHSRA